MFGIVIMLASLYAFVHAVSSDPPLIHWIVAGPIFMVIGVVIYFLSGKDNGKDVG